MRPEASPDTATFERDLFRAAPDELLPPAGGDCYILGSGPKGAVGWHRIPAGAYLMALNKAIMIAFQQKWPWKPAMWLCATPEYLRHPEKYPWWAEANRLCREHAIPRVFSWQLAAQGADYEYTFYTCPSFGDQQAPAELVPGVLRSGGTIAGITVQLPALCGSARGIFCGVDLRGAGYFDGSLSERREAGEEFSEIEIAARTVRACQRAGLTVCTLTETALSNYVELERV